MKAITCTRPGLLEYLDIKPPVCLPGQAIIRIKRIGICGTDLHAYEGTQPFFNYPRILGHELSGDLVEADGVSGFLTGEPLTCIPYIGCGHCIACRNGKPNCCVDIKVLGVHVDGGMVEYLSVPIDLLVKSQGLGYDELAMVEPLAIGLHGVRRAGVAEGEYVLVSGAGPIGLGTMEMARIAGGQVIAVDINESRLKFCRDHIGVAYTINALSENVMERLREITHGDMPTVVMDATGNREAINNALQYLAHGGRFVLIGLQKEMISFSHPEFHKRESTLMSSRNATRADFEDIISSISNGRLVPAKYITHRSTFDSVKGVFDQWLGPAAGVIKAMVYLD